MYACAGAPPNANKKSACHYLGATHTHTPTHTHMLRIARPMDAAAARRGARVIIVDNDSDDEHALALHTDSALFRWCTRRTPENAPLPEKKKGKAAPASDGSPPQASHTSVHTYNIKSS